MGSILRISRVGKFLQRWRKIHAHVVTLLPSSLVCCDFAEIRRGVFLCKEYYSDLDQFIAHIAC